MTGQLTIDRNREVGGLARLLTILGMCEAKIRGLL